MLSKNRFDRLELLYESHGLECLADSSVAIFGLGGVGSYAAEALARGGVGKLTLVDFDNIDITNCNRQIHALDETIGRAKVQVMAERCRSINPEINVKPVQVFYSQENSDQLLKDGFDYVLDCIDHITAKLHLIETCVNREIRIISSMGAANKLDPTKVVVSDLVETHRCRLARILRRELRRREITRGVKTVFSVEEFRPLSAGRRGQGMDDVGHYQEQRAPLGSSSVVPPIFGLTMAGEVIRDLLERPSL